ncbi:MAG: methionine synthase [Stygiobacter sp. RIFOXYA12_FULL_38_9]|nr:MAG: methionine synthase [Stygiobacter sp. RIFOXYA12_FULL_38_9]OGV06527.1 MAG: methionine synthase [Stygiobacter sp. RIFOXYB2_FULL_37_11]OGV13212.1 MAG: methionine synthase [Stygiobacter sp. RIFOXYC2_FULL_38_25]OGV14647.1 MAG: methionine synthase [Stygiobacter sp. RIFOXYA2_FULL_38_8]OGV83258.1 MAG: methionine synthase [Stygiobacter sp. GWF2_38_21]RJQ58623.1 MAG: methionine synthase [Stygiobacter sp.]
MKSVLEEIEKGKVLVSDGAWGTYLYQRGLKQGECPELWNVAHREDVFAIAKSYIDAGADIILTNSFGGSPFRLRHYRLDKRTIELNNAAAEISREAAGDNHFVLGSIGPSGSMLMLGETTESELYDGFSLQAEALKKGGVDAICIETMTDVQEASIAVRAAKAATSLCVACTFTFDKTATGDFTTMMGISPGEMVLAMKNVGADIIGTNCGNGIENMIGIVKEIRAVDQATPVLVQANAGLPVFVDNKVSYPETPEMMANRVNELIDCGANIIGGCCGTTPLHITAIAAEIRSRK